MLGFPGPRGLKGDDGPRGLPGDKGDKGIRGNNITSTTATKNQYYFRKIILNDIYIAFYGLEIISGKYKNIISESIRKNTVLIF